MKVRNAALAKAAQGQVHRRSRTVRHGHGRFATSETLTTEVVAVTDLSEYLQFGPPPLTDSYNFVSCMLYEVITVTMGTRLRLVVDAPTPVEAPIATRCMRCAGSFGAAGVPLQAVPDPVR